MVVLIMGVSGAGKSTLAQQLAVALQAGYAEGDDYHPAWNVAKMAAGMPLDDADRWPWLSLLAAEINTWLATGKDMVLTCSALKKAYRQHLGLMQPGVRLVYLDGSQAFIADRLRSRDGHYMPASLLASQFAALEAPNDDEAAIRIAVSLSTDAAVTAIKIALADSTAAAKRSPQ